jgi:hypothetical protein
MEKSSAIPLVWLDVPPKVRCHVSLPALHWITIFGATCLSFFINAIANIAIPSSISAALLIGLPAFSKCPFAVIAALNRSALGVGPTNGGGSVRPPPDRPPPPPDPPPIPAILTTPQV